jgi:hypothetical protein
MKRFVIAFIAALLVLVFASVPALAWGEPNQGASADVNCEEPSFSDDDPSVGDTIIFYGTVHVDAFSYNNKNYPDGSPCGYTYITGAYSSVGGSTYYVVYGPDGTTVVASGGDSWSDFQVGDTGGYWDEDTMAGISEDWYWEAFVLLDIAGDYTVEQGGEASAEYGNWIQYGHYEVHWDGWYPVKVWVPDGDPVYYVEGDPAYDSCFIQKTVTCLGGQAVLGKPHAVLTIALPDGRKLFFGSDGWDDPTDQGISFSDGTWQVDIAIGTLIELDGKWHMLTTLTVDDQGQVTFEYGKSGTTATDIGLSQPIVITKVG